VGMLAALAAEVIDVGVTIVTAPARWTAQGLRWYAAHAEDPAPRPPDSPEPEPGGAAK
jgi:hypothetical protein